MSCKAYLKRRVVQLLPDRLYLKLLFCHKMGYSLNLRSPKTFSEKLQWLKLYDRKPEYTQMVDKAAVKDYVAGIIGKEHIIQTIGVWDKTEDIDWESLPNQFVLKTTHGGGNEGVVICRDKSTFDKNDAVRKLNDSMAFDIYTYFREWPYKNVPKRIIAEQYLDPTPNNYLLDYKFFCFNGEPKYCQVISNRDTKMCIDFFDKNWNHQPFHEPHNFPFADIEPEKPRNFDFMWRAAAKLASDKIFSRIDFYDMGNRVYFGEITFYPTSGMGGFNPKEYDLLFGNMIRLPK